ncbi:ricin B lectin (PTP6a) [Vairimorpha necatrix]|uniref:Ricin B lectin (PTP6a) n=1 Tax=Vairimorpha necatrix TaxID=6039 RepID=A0AAX4J851_9MICR
MKFSLKYLPLVFYTGRSVYIKHLNQDLYMCDVSLPVKNDRPITQCEKDEATNFALEGDTANIHIVHTPVSNGVWDIGRAGFIKIFTQHGNSNQNFYFKEIGDRINIMQNSKCVEWDDSTKRYVLRSCDGSDEQKFMKLDKLPHMDYVDDHGHLSHHLIGECPINTPFSRDKSIYDFDGRLKGDYHHRDHNHHSHRCHSSEHFLDHDDH